MMLSASVTMETAVWLFLLKPPQKHYSLFYWQKYEAKWTNRRAEVQRWWCEDLTKGSVCFAGNEAPTSRSLISEFIRPLQISGDKPELLSVKPTFLTRSRAGSPARAFLSEVPTAVWLHHSLFQKQVSFMPHNEAKSRCCDWMQPGAVVEKRPPPFLGISSQFPQIKSCHQQQRGVAQINNPAGFDLGFNSNVSGDHNKHVDGVCRVFWGFSRWSLMLEVISLTGQGSVYWFRCSARWPPGGFATSPQ